jgi:hypothetical protein
MNKVTLYVGWIPCRRKEGGVVRLCLVAIYVIHVHHVVFNGLLCHCLSVLL